MSDRRTRFTDYDGKQVFALILLTLINALFCFKYASRLSLIGGAAITAGYSAMVFLWWKLTSSKRCYLGAKRALALSAFFTVGILFLFYRIGYSQLNVDRWEIIDLFWNSVKEGKYPYSAQTPQGNYPGAMPVYFMLYYPFYLLREVGILTLAVILNTLFICYQQCDKYRFSFLFGFILTSPALLWELTTRSTLIVNGVAILLYVYLLLHADLRKFGNALLMAILGSLALCMRGVFVVPLILWGIHALYRKEVSWSDMIRFGMLFVSFFVLLYLPFLSVWPEEFMQHNPFLIESSGLMPLAYTLVSLITAVGIGFLYRRKEDLFFYSGISLLIVFGCYLFAMTKEIGWVSTYLESSGDISYSLFSFPFLLFAIAQRSPKRFFFRK